MIKSEADDYFNTNKAKKGLKSEEEIIKWLENNYIEWFGAIEVIEHHTDKKTQFKGIDITITSTSGIHYPSGKIQCDIKHDTHLGVSGNVFLETHEVRGNYIKDGWLYYSQSDYILFHGIQVDKLYVISLAGLRYLNWLCSTGQIEDYKWTWNYDRFEGKKMIGLLLSEKYVLPYTQIYILGGQENV